MSDIYIYIYLYLSVLLSFHKVHRILIATDCSRCWVQGIQRVDFLSERIGLPWLCKFIVFKRISIPRKYSPLVYMYEYCVTHTYKEYTQTTHLNIFTPLPDPNSVNSAHKFLVSLINKYLIKHVSFRPLKRNH